MARTAILVLALSTALAAQARPTQKPTVTVQKPPVAPQKPTAAPAQPQKPPPPPPPLPTLTTRWASLVSPTNALPEYPRPQMARRDWLNLNGQWDYAIRPRFDQKPESFDGKILVPYPIESQLSGVRKAVGEANRLWYRRTFEVPRQWRGRRTLLHFGAVDWDAIVTVNGQEVVRHRGGYDGFSADITSALTPAGPQELVVSVWDPTDLGWQPRGKQVNKPGGIWYSSVTGIWQTVWLEPVPDASIEGLHIVPDIDAGVLQVTTTVSGATPDVIVTATALEGRREMAKASGRPGEALSLRVPNAQHWSPDTPNLYDLHVSVARAKREVDTVYSYFAMRKTSLCKDPAGIMRLCLNNKPLVQVGLLDQGWWPDGLYTAPTDEGLRYDIDATKQLGFNMARKHVKVEPDRWYYWADRMGLLVWQDMPNISPKAARTAESTAQFEKEWKAVIDQLRNHPSIVMWVPFNEGWGQYDTQRITEWTKSYDPTRLVNNASGWTDAGAGDVIDIHRYPGPGAPKVEATRASVLGEFGGLGLPVKDHTWQSQANWSYRGYTTKEEYTDAYVTLLERLHPLFGSPGLSAAVYTQTTDVEIEVNGVITYDRARVKGDITRIRDANRALFTRPPVVRTVVPASRDSVASWKYSTTKPADTWMAADFNDAGWQSGPGGFGTAKTPGASIGTVWNTSDIWLRGTFELPADTKLVNPRLFLHHDEDAEVYLNGVLAAKVSGFATDYELTAISLEAQATLKPGRNLVAVHCRQTTGGQFVDVGLVDLAPESKEVTLLSGLQEQLDDLRQRAGFPGATVSIVLEDGRTLDVASGSAGSTPLTPASRMPAGSVGKTFIAAAILKAVDDRNLTLDNPIEMWIGRQLWFPRLPNSRELTLRQLLNHRSGIPEVLENDAFMTAITTNLDRQWLSSQLIAFVLDQKPRSKVGAKYFYTDMNYILAGAVYERAMNRPLFMDIEHKILQPLGLTDTVPAARRDMTNVVPGRLEPEVLPYAKFGMGDSSMRNGQFTYNVQAEHAGGGFISTSHDLARWASLLWTGKVFSQARLAEMLDGKPTDRGTSYGLGTELMASARGPVYMHDGWIFGYQTAVLYLPDQKLAAAIQVNADPNGTAPDAVLGRLVSWVLRNNKK
jgi:CubicO group peptidase (beta-lactamase class C family)